MHGGDIYVQTLPDGSPQRLTDDAQNNGEPRWSPSGQWISWRSDQGEWVMRADGTGRRRIAGPPFGWSVDDRLVYESSLRALIVVENADGSDRYVLNRDAGPGTKVDFMGAAFSPDGRHLAFGEVVMGDSPGRRLRAAIWSVDDSLGSLTEVYDAGDPPADGLVVVGWSPDGQSILLGRDLGFSASLGADGYPLEVVRADGGSATPLTPGTLTGLGFEPRPGGDVIAIDDGGGRETWTNKRVALVDVTKGVVTPLTDSETASISPAWSPDGSQIAYVAAPDAGPLGGGDPARVAMAQRRVWLIGADGSNRHQLTNDGAYRDERPNWSPDGSQIVFARLDDGDRASLWTVPSGGGAPRQIANDLSPNPEAGAPFWFGYYGKINWDSLFDVWRPSVTFPSSPSTPG